MNAFEQGIARPTLSQIVLTIILTLGAAFLDQFDLVRSTDRMIEYSLLSPLLYQTETDAAYLIIAVDTPLVDEFGCPPYDDSKLTKIESALSQIDIKNVILPDGDHSWLSPSTRNLPGHIKYSVPISVHFDSYSKNVAIHRPTATPRVRPIDAYSAVTVQNDGFVETFPAPPLGTEHLMSFPQWLAQQSHADARGPRHQEFIRFSGPSGTIPSLPLSRILSRDFTSADIQNRIVLLGTTAAHCQHQLPVPSDHRGMSKAEILVHATQTLFSPPFDTMALWARVLLIFFISLMAMFGISRIRFGTRFMSLGLVMLTYVSMSLATAYFFGMLIPLIAPMASVLASYIFFSVRNASILVRKLRENNDIINLEVEKWARTSDEDDHQNTAAKASFEYLVNFITDFLPVRGAYLFLLPLNSFHYRLLLSINLGEDDIQERRRDIRRMPWLGAISAGQGAHLRNFMGNESVDAYGIPLFDFGTVLGMIVLALPAEEEVPERTRRLLERVGTFMSGSLIAARTRHSRRNAVSESLRSFLAQDALRAELATTQSITASVRHQLQRYRHILDETRLGIMVSDLLGNIFYMNSSATEFISSARIEFTKRLSDLLSSLGQRNQISISDILESAILAEHVKPFEWADPRSEKIYQLTIIGMSLDEQEKDSAEATQVTALLVTINDVTMSRQLDRLRGRVLALASSKGKHIVDTAKATIAPPPAFDAGYPTISEALYNETWQDLYGVFEQFMRLSEKIDNPLDRIDETPFDPIMTVKELLTEFEPLTNKKGIKLKLQSPNVITPAYCDWSSFKQGLHALISDTIRSCYKGNTIFVRIGEEETSIHLTVTDSSAIVSTNLLAAISEQQWEDVPSELSRGLKTFAKGKIPFYVTTEGETGVIFHVELNKL